MNPTNNTRIHIPSAPSLTNHHPNSNTPSLSTSSSSHHQTKRPKLRLSPPFISTLFVLIISLLTYQLVPTDWSAFSASDSESSNWSSFQVPFFSGTVDSNGIEQEEEDSLSSLPKNSLQEALTSYNHSNPFLNIAILTHPRQESIHLLSTIDSFFLGFMAWADDEKLRDFIPSQWMPFQISLVERPLWDGQHHSLTAMKAIYEKYIQEDFMKIYPLKQVRHEYHGKWDHSQEKESKDARARRFSHVLDLLMTIEAQGEAAGKYILIVEDDFPLCKDALPNLLKRIAEAEQLEKQKKSTPCGMFIGTGGSGFLLRRDTGLRQMVSYLQNLDEKTIRETPHDVLMQNCLHSPNHECHRCQNRWYIVDSLYIYHTGWLHSTRGVLYPRHKWQCGWMNPLLVDVPSSNVLLTDRSWAELFRID